jgi:hypothetical protein
MGVDALPPLETDGDDGDIDRVRYACPGTYLDGSFYARL